MRGVFDDEESEEARPRRDTELTLGLGSLLLIFLGLVVVCGLCFGLGYTLGGRHGAEPDVAAGQLPAASAQSPVEGHGSLSKPSATAQTVLAPPAQTAAPQSGTLQPGAAGPPQSAAPLQTSGPAAASSAQTLVRPALPAPASPVQVASASNAAPALPVAATLMVQIAAVSHLEDADVLVAALRKRGYAVSAQREPADNLIHVRIGPFNNRDEANRWRTRLLNDGYNAMIQP